MKLPHWTTAALSWRLSTATPQSHRSLLSNFTLDCSTSCSQTLCSCISTSHSPTTCASELNDVCTSGIIDQCVPPAGINQFRALHCPYAECLTKGRSETECECEFYNTACDVYSDENMGYCEMAECCKESSDDEGKIDCLKSDFLDGARPGDLKISGGQFVQSAFELDDTIMMHNDDAKDVTDDDSVMGDDESEVTWINQTDSQLSQSAKTIEEDWVSRVDPDFSLPLGFARFCSASCDPSLCTCLTLKKNYADCVSELYFSCRETTIEQCVPDTYANDFEQVYCPYVECVMLGDMEGSSKESCNHERFAKLCDMYGNEEDCALAKTEAPTDEPSAEPTVEPTNKPSFSPSTKPTASPTTASPTEAPTSSPITSKPTNKPTNQPSLEPTESPTTVSLTEVPTLSPITSKPTNKPTQKPTNQPSSKPTESPTTVSPKKVPTLSPISPKPTNKPTQKPTTESPTSVSPTEVSTLSPISSKPTNRPSPKPTTASPITDSPTEVPTSSPITSKPTKKPSPKPTSQSSVNPTYEPSFSPTVTPSWSPTFAPTIEPSVSSSMSSDTSNPSSSPTSPPTTTKPTKYPTSKPSMSPSTSPSSKPTKAPVSSKPSTSPTNSPVTMNPSASPTGSPITNKPSKNPTPLPSKNPTSSPVTEPPTEPIVYCPDAFDELWASSYSTGTQVEVSGFIYECNPYPYSIYCKFSDYQPVYGSELWSDAWTEISRCDPPSSSPTDSPTKKPTKRPTSPPTSMLPTNSPTGKPSNHPSAKPTMLPSANPTEQPTLDSTSSPSGSPSIAQTATPKIEVTSTVQFQMQIMTKTMNQYEQFGVFEPSCRDFLTKQLFNEEPRVSNIECKVTNQQLLSSGRMLNDASLRQLQELTSLLVDVEASGEVVPTEDITSSNDVNFDDMVYDAFAEDSDIFINSLKNKGDIAGIDTFDELDSVTSVTQNTNKDAISEGSGSSNKGMKTGALAALVIGGVAFILLIIAFVYQVRIHFADDDSFDDDDDLDRLGLSLPPSNIDCPVVQSEDSAQRNDSNLSYAYSLDNGIDSPNSFVSAAKQAWDGGAPMRVQREIVAPAGKLGIIIDTSSQGPIVHSVKTASVLEGLVFEGDLIIALDDEDTSAWSAHNLTKLVASRSKFERKITVLSTVSL